MNEVLEEPMTAEVQVDVNGMLVRYEKLIADIACPSACQVSVY